ncbi:hypothetical protein VE03_10511, partial [Pseudogymnoascus sp. 23342-1-I1]
MENDGGANGNNANNGNNNRLFLNFNNDDRFSPTDRAYPTTPSTFPQPVFQAQGQNNQGQRYFMNNPYPSNNQQNNQYQPAQQGYAQPSYQSRGAPGNADSTTNGLVHQFSHQNLGGAARGNQYARQPTGAQRPRTAGSNAAAAPVVPQQPELEQAPERNPDKYGPLTHNNQKRCAQLASDFFKDSVKRARDRNLRQSEMEQRLKDPNMSQARREQTWANTGRQEGKDKPDNYKTLQIIGKGAFGEVKLVQKKQDGRVYAMKSLVKTEMFKKDQLAHMEFLPGGDLMTMLIKYEIFSEDITRFYIAAE